MKKEAEDLVQPIIVKLYQQSGSAGADMPEEKGDHDERVTLEGYLDDNQDNEASEFKRVKKEAEDLVQPIIVKLYQQSGSASADMPEEKGDHDERVTLEGYLDDNQDNEASEFKRVKKEAEDLVQPIIVKLYQQSGSAGADMPEEKGDHDERVTLEGYLDDNQDNEASEFKRVKKEAEDLVQPIIVKLYQQSGSASADMPEEKGDHDERVTLKGYLDDNQDNEASEFKRVKKEAEDLVQPIIVKLYQQSGSASADMPEEKGDHDERVTLEGYLDDNQDNEASEFKRVKKEAEDLVQPIIVKLYQQSGSAGADMPEEKGDHDERVTLEGFVS